jgi:Bacterial Ig-like domain (group 3)
VKLSANCKLRSSLLLILTLLIPASLHASRSPGRDLPSSTNGGCPTVNPSCGTTPYLGAFPAVGPLSGSNFTVTITPYVWGQVSGSGTAANPYSVTNVSTIMNVVLTSSNPNVRMLAIAVGATASNSLVGYAGYMTPPTMSTPAVIPYTGSTSSDLSLSDPVEMADAGYTVWALGASAPNNVALLFGGGLNTSTTPTQMTPTDVMIPYPPSPLLVNGPTQPSSSSSYAVVVYNGTGYEIVGGLPLLGEPGPCGGTQLNASVTCHTTTTNITLTGAGFTDLTRADNAPTSSAPSTNTGDAADDAAVCTNSLANSSSMYHRVTYTYTPATNQTVGVSTAGSHYATVVTVTGGSVSKCSTLALDYPDYQAALGSLALTAGTQYTIMVGEYPPLLLQPGSFPENTCDQFASVATPCPFSADPVLHFALTVTPDATASTLSCPSQSVTAGQPVTCTATVSDTTTSTNTPTGNVQFTFTPTSGSNPAVTLTGALTANTAQVSTSSLLAGTYQVVATLQPSSGLFLASNASTSVTVVLTQTTTSASASQANPAAGSSFNITSSVGHTTGTQTPTGTLTLLDNGASTGTTASVSSTPAGLAVTSATVGNHSYTVAYSGDSLYAASTSSAVPVVVGKDTSSVTLTSSAASIDQNASVTLTATVANSSSTNLTPTGIVTFLNGSTTLGTGTLTSGVASFTTSSLSAAVGAFNLTASYAGDSNFSSSASSTLSVSVVAAAFNVTLEQQSATVKQGANGSAKIDLAAVGGFVQTVTFSCSGLPALTTCAFTPPSITPDSAGDPASTTLTIATNVTSASLTPLGKSDRDSSLSTALAAAAFLILGRFRRGTRKRLRNLLLMTLVLGSLTSSLIGCGGGSGGGGGNVQSVTPVGAYTVTINATPANGSPKSLTLQLTITN